MSDETGEGEIATTNIPTSRRKESRALGIALALNAAFLVIEVGGVVAFNSLALAADAAHMASDVVGLTIAMIANVVATRGGSARHTYGLQRAEVLAGVANGLLLLAASFWVIYEGIHRVASPTVVRGGGVALVATVGLVINAVSAIVVARPAGTSLNMRGAFIHMAGDAAASVAALVAGLVIMISAAYWVDGAASVVIGLLVVWAAFGLLRDATNVLLEAAPRNLDLVAIESALGNEEFVETVHHLHVWNLASDVPALSAHVVIAGEVTLHQAQIYGEMLKRILDERFGIDHSTLELECHACDE